MRDPLISQQNTYPVEVVKDQWDMSFGKEENHHVLSVVNQRIKEVEEEIEDLIGENAQRKVSFGIALEEQNYWIGITEEAQTIQGLEREKMSKEFLSIAHERLEDIADWIEQLRQEVTTTWLDIHQKQRELEYLLAFGNEDTITGAVVDDNGKLLLN